MQSWLFVPDPDPDFLPIPDPDSQHWSKTVFKVRKIGVPDSRSGSAPDLDLPTTLVKVVFICFEDVLTIQNLVNTVCFKLRRLEPCLLSGLQWDVKGSNNVNSLPR